MNKLNELKQILENDEKQITTTSVQWIKNQHPTTTSSMGNKVVLHSSSKANASSIVSSEKEANTVHAWTTVSAVKLAQTGVVHFTSEAPNTRSSVRRTHYHKWVMKTQTRQFGAKSH